MECWPTAAGRAFYFRDRLTRQQVIALCRQQLGRSHGSNSSWQVAHAVVPHLKNHPAVPVILIRDANVITQICLTYS